MKILLFLSLILPQESLPQDSLPPIADLYASLQQYHLSQTNAQLAQFEETKKGEWLKYVPNISFGYGLGTKKIDGQTQVVGKFRPSINFSTSLIYNIKKGKQIQTAKIKSIQSTQLLLLQDAKRKLTQLLANYYQEIQSLQFAEQIQEIDDQIFTIQETKFQKRELTPLQYLPIKRAYLTKQYQLTAKRKTILTLKTEIILHSKFQIGER